MGRIELLTAISNILQQHPSAAGRPAPGGGGGAHCAQRTSLPPVSKAILQLEAGRDGGCGTSKPKGSTEAAA